MNCIKAIIFIAVLLIFTSAVAFSGETSSIKKDCGICHASHMGGMLLKEPLSGLCIGCHPDRVEADHAVDIVPLMNTGGLPLDKEGRMTCVTCHDPHDRGEVKAMLRDEPKKLCGRCHKRQGG